MNEANPTTLAFYITTSHPCSYLENREAVTLFADPEVNISTQQYSKLITYGFRRSGTHIYRPRCPQCDACIPIRIPVNDFKPNRNQKRVLKTNTDIQIITRPAEFSEEHFELYRLYISTRHAGGGMDDPAPDKYSEFLISPWIDTVFYEFRLDDELVAVAVADQLAGGLSAVYTFFHPDLSNRSLGTFSILKEIELAQQQGLDYLYLGYWVQNCDKMSYKTNFQSHETLVGSQWVKNQT